MDYAFSEQQLCPACHSAFQHAEQKKEFAPVVVVICPQCNTSLWRAGFGEDSKLFVFDPNADDAI